MKRPPGVSSGLRPGKGATNSRNCVPTGIKKFVRPYCATPPSRWHTSNPKNLLEELFVRCQIFRNPRNLAQPCPHMHFLPLRMTVLVCYRSSPAKAGSCSRSTLGRSCPPSPLAKVIGQREINRLAERIRAGARGRFEDDGAAAVIIEDAGHALTHFVDKARLTVHEQCRPPVGLFDPQAERCASLGPFGQISGLAPLQRFRSASRSPGTERQSQRLAP